MERFAREFGLTAGTSVLDVGGVPDTWALLDRPPRVTLLNTPRTGEELASADAWVAGDGRSLPFRDGAFDVVFSNSVIEHVGDRASQLQFAREIGRVGRGYWVQTPNRWFPVESHLLTPLIHWLPRRVQRALLPISIWGLWSGADADRRRYYFEHYMTEIRLLGAREMRALFPDAIVIRERVCGLTKSLIVIKR
jgi:SAM-dependent methyltransferase